MSPGASSFPCGLSGGDSGRGSQQSDGGRGPGSRRLLPLPPLGRDPPPSRSRLALSGLLAGAAFWDWRWGGDTRPVGPQPPPWRKVLRPPVPILSRSGSGGQGRGAPGIPLSGSWGGGTALRTCPVRARPLAPVTRGSWGMKEGGEELGVPRCHELGARKGDSALDPLLSRIGSRKEGRRSRPPCPATRSR